MHAAEQKRCTTTASAAKRARTCSLHRLNDTHRRTLHDPRAANIIRWREALHLWQVTSMEGASMGCCLPRLHVSALVVRPFPLPTLPTTKPVWTLSCVIYQCRYPREPRRSYYVAFWSRMYAQKILCPKYLMETGTTILKAMPSRHVQQHGKRHTTTAYEAMESCSTLRKTHLAMLGSRRHFLQGW